MTRRPGPDCRRSAWTIHLVTLARARSGSRALCLVDQTSFEGGEACYSALTALSHHCVALLLSQGRHQRLAQGHSSDFEPWYPQCRPSVWKHAGCSVWNSGGP